MAKGGARLHGAPAAPRRALAQMGSCGPRWACAGLAPSHASSALDLWRASSKVALLRWRWWPELLLWCGSDPVCLDQIISVSFLVSFGWLLQWCGGHRYPPSTTTCFHGGGSNCNCILPVSISLGETVFGHGENPARQRLTLTTVTPAGAASSLEAWSWA
jgi:hypothetical protein